MFFRCLFVIRFSMIFLLAALLFMPYPALAAAFQVTSASAVPATATPGQNVTLNASVLASGTANNMIVDLEIYNATGSRMAQTFYQSQNFAAGRTTPYTWNYTVPAGTATGTYTLKLGVFTGGWASNPYWNNSLASYQVATSPSPSGTTIPSATQIVDSNGNVWTLVTGVVIENGRAAGYSANVILLLYYNGVIYQENSAKGWWSWSGSTWIAASGDPRGPSVTNGQCGSANGASLTSVPTANLCASGIASAVSGGGPWNWTCAGSNGGSTALCSASVAATPVDGQCGSANGAVLDVAPTTNLCSAGSASAVSGSGPWLWSCNGTNGGTTASCSAPASQANGQIPVGLPGTFFIGLSVAPGSNQTWVASSGVPWAVCYQYISSGVLPNQSWVTTWGTNFAYNYAVSSRSVGCVPQLTYYQMEPTIGTEGASQEYAALNNPSTMGYYYKDFTALMQQLHQYGGPTLVHVEPDMFGYLEPINGDPTKLTAAVASSGNADLVGHPNTVAGFGQALLHLRDLYAPNVVLGAHVSTWLWNLSTDPSLNVTQIADNDAAFMTGLGNWDLFFTDITDRDAAYYQFVLKDGGVHWWNAGNVKYPNFNRLNTWASAFTSAAHKRLVIWQIPIGNTIMDTLNNTNYHYQDNRAQYWLQNYPSNQALNALAQSGVIGLLFGAGNSGTTQNYDAAHDGITNPAPINGNTGVSSVSDDDGGFLRLSVGNYYRSGPVVLH